jgi:hypothetical protein
MEFIAIIVCTLLVLLVVWLNGKESGEAKGQQEVLNDVQKAAEVDREIDALSPDAKRDRLRKH